MTSKYSLIIRTSGGTELAELAGLADERRFTVSRNRAEQISWRIELGAFQQYLYKVNKSALELLAVNQNEIVVKRHGVPFVAGQIAQLETVVQDNQRYVDVKAVGFLDLFAKRLTSANDVHTAQDAGALAWELIDDSQTLTNGDYGITQGTIETTTNRTRTYEYKPVKQAIIDLSEVYGGFDFEFTHDKKFNVFAAQGARLESRVLQYPGNIKSMRIPRSGIYMVNEVLVRGSGFGLAQLRDTVDDTTTQSTYKLRQEILDHPIVVEVDTLTEIGEEYVAANKDILELPQIVIDGNQDPTINSFWVGDEVRLVINEIPTANHIDGFYRIEQLEVVVDRNDSEEIKLTLSEA